MPFPIPAAEIAKTEAKLGVTFPDGFKRAMEEENGGEIVAANEFWQLVPFLDASDKTRLAVTSDDIVQETEAARDWRRFPPTGIPIAQGADGDLLILMPLEGHATRLGETIYQWNHQTGVLTEVGRTLVDLRQ